MPDAAQQLARLSAELEEKLQARLAAIEEGCQARIERLESEHRAALEAQIGERRDAQRRRLAAWRRRCQRKLQITRQERCWVCQHSCVQQLLAQASERLSREPLDPERLQAWLAQQRATLRLSHPLSLKLKPQWVAQLAQEGGAAAVPEGVGAILPEAMLGGWVLVDGGQQFEVDASWDRRLEDLTPQLWQQWLHRVGEDHQN